MSRVKTWEISDAFWKLAEPLLPQTKRDPQKEYKNKPGAGRPPADRRMVFSAIVFVLRTGIQWNAVPREKFNICPSSVHAYFQKWSKSGVFRALWQRGLVEYDELEGIAWEWQAIDGSMVKSPLGQEAVGPNPTDRGKKRKQTPRFGRRAWRPVVDRRNRGKRE
jgi:transposase